jgi:hypothetical protein
LPRSRKRVAVADVAGEHEARVPPRHPGGDEGDQRREPHGNTNGLAPDAKGDDVGRGLGAQARRQMRGVARYTTRRVTSRLRSSSSTRASATSSRGRDRCRGEPAPRAPSPHEHHSQLLSNGYPKDNLEKVGRTWDPRPRISRRGRVERGFIPSYADKLRPRARQRRALLRWRNAPLPTGGADKTEGRLFPELRRQ